MYRKDGLVVLVGVFASELARPSLSFCSLTYTGFRWLFIVLTHFHFAEQSFALHFLLKCAKCLIDIIVADDNFYQKNIPPSGIFAGFKDEL